VSGGSSKVRDGKERERGDAEPATTLQKLADAAADARAKALNRPRERVDVRALLNVARSSGARDAEEVVSEAVSRFDELQSDAAPLQALLVVRVKNGARNQARGEGRRQRAVNRAHEEGALEMASGPDEDVLDRKMEGLRYRACKAYAAIGLAEKYVADRRQQKRRPDDTAVRVLKELRAYELAMLTGRDPPVSMLRQTREKIAREEKRARERKWGTIAAIVGLLVCRTRRAVAALQPWKAALALAAAVLLVLAAMVGVPRCARLTEEPPPAQRRAGSARTQPSRAPGADAGLNGVVSARRRSGLLPQRSGGRHPEGDPEDPWIERWVAEFDGTRANLVMKLGRITVASSGSGAPRPDISIDRDGFVTASIAGEYLGLGRDNPRYCEGAVEQDVLLIHCQREADFSRSEASGVLMLGSLDRDAVRTQTDAGSEEAATLVCGNSWRLLGGQTVPHGAWCISPTARYVQPPRWFLHAPARGDYQTLCQARSQRFCKGVLTWSFRDPR